MHQTLHRFGLAAAVLLSASAARAGLPQIDDTTWYANQLLWLAVSFFVLYGAVSLILVPTIGGVLSKRASAISEAIAEAERAKHEAETSRGAAELATSNARARVAEIMANTQAAITSEAGDAMNKLDRELARRAEHATAVLEDAVAKASANVDAVIDDLAQAMVSKLLGGHTAAAPLRVAMKG